MTRNFFESLFKYNQKCHVISSASCFCYFLVIKWNLNCECNSVNKKYENMTNIVNLFLHLLVCMQLLTKLILISSLIQQGYQNILLMFYPNNGITKTDAIPFVEITMALRSVIKYVNLVFVFFGSLNECAIVLDQGKLSERLSNKNTNRLITPISSILLVNIIMIVFRYE